jgi:hypothetical protein
MKLPKARFITLSEYKIAFRIFGDALPSRKRIIITNISGFGGRPFTLPVSFFGFLFFILNSILLLFWTNLAVLFLIFALLIIFFNPFYLINVGKRCYENLENDCLGVLIHEMAHVWQGESNIFSFWFVLNSCFHQALKGLNAYKYELGEDWRAMNVEQQASLIEDWVLQGESTEDPRWSYMKYVKTGN